MSHMKSVVVSLHSVTRLGSAPPHAPRTPILLPSFLRKLLFSTSLCIHLPSGAVKPAAPRRQLRQCDLKTSNKFSVTRSSLSSTAAVEMGKTRKETLAYGAWKSPLTADFVSGASKGLAGAALDSEGHLIWLEGRPSESGRAVLVREGADTESPPIDITPAGFNVRTTVHEYGGGAFTVEGDTVIFSNYVDQRLYKQSLVGDHTPVPLTPAYEGRAVRYADGEFDLKFDRYIIVREDNRQAGKEAVNEIVSVELNGDPNAEPKVLVKGNDFYMFPRLSPDGQKLAWVEWSHPNMPWDQTSVWVGEVSDSGEITDPICVAGGDKGIVEAPTEPRWSPQGELIFVSDRDGGFWNLYRWGGKGRKLQALYPLEAEFTRPAWIFGNSSFAFTQLSGVESAYQIVCTYRQRGVSHLAILDPSSLTLSTVKTAFTDIYGLFAKGNDIYLTGGSAVDAMSLAKISLTEGGRATSEESIIWSSLGLDTAQYKPYFSTPKVIEFPTKVAGQTAFANFYPPSNGDFDGPNGEKPPLLVRSHGGPTSEAKTTLDLAIQYWTSRGWAFADVNYGGSTGYGREFRERLYGEWGIVDVNDCCSCAEYLVNAGEVDAKRLCIDGRSAGGYTTMAALVFSDTFTAGATLFGIGDLTVFETETHKFESRYLDSLIDKGKKLYDRSPINFLDRLSCPVIVFQGLEDKVVPPNQARLIYKAVKAKGIPVALIEYEGEQHGFRKAENIRNTLEQEMVFFARLIGGFQVADDITPIKIDNYDK
ncbi:unnamed protein product [Sphagnum jensenii]|uniref:Peptidase S9 prolyl oligopeptidase catalytic domain-containing protein n=1 Tax=Sphagnum jensenii TaxID=128206 RepID=A0ABP0ZZ44_9BRYO